MQVYVSELARTRTELETRLELIEAIAKIIHRPPFQRPDQAKTNFDVQVRNTNATVTFPTARLARVFLAATEENPVHLFQRQTPLRFRHAQADHSRPIIPHPELIRSLKQTPFKPTQELIQEIKELETINKPLPITLISFGNIIQHLNSPAFSPQSTISFSPPQSCHLRFDPNLKFILLTWSSHSSTHAILIEISILHKIEATQPAVILWLERPPRLEEVSNKDYSYFSHQQEHDLRTRVHKFDHTKTNTFPFSNDRIRIEFGTNQAFEEFCAFKVTLPLPRITPSQRLVLQKAHYDQDRIQDIHQNLVCFTIPVGFQIECLLHNRILLPYQIIRVCKAIMGIDEILVEKALIKFIELYKDLTNSPEDTTPQPTQVSREPVYLQILQSALKISAKEIRLLGSSFQTPDSFPCRTVIITPTRLCLQGPQTEQSNSILRLYQQTENFLRVSLADEDANSLRAGRNIDIQHLLRTRYLPFLIKGLILCGRKFEFLGYSSSALKDHQAWFVCPFHKDGELVTAASIRAKLGDFSKVIRIPARYMARIAQAFTSTRKSLTLRRSEVTRMQDVKQGDNIFTDGVGTISKALADQVHKVLNEGRSRGIKSISSTCYQIRLGGFKGMLSLDPTLKGKMVRMRPSMDKFDAPDSLTLDIAEVFLNLQEKQISQVENSRSTPKLAAELMRQYSLASASQMPSTLTKLHQLLGNDGVRIRSDFVEECYDLMVMQCLKDLKYRARIPLEKSYTLVGVADEDNFLPPDSIYACIQHPHLPPQYLSGTYVITRSPSLHPGDVRVVTAVGKLDPKLAPRLSSLINCVAFPVQGSRSLPSCLGGGDLDGDLYTLIGLRGLIPSRDRVHPPATYAPPQMRQLDGDCTISDGAEFFLDYISSDLVGIIATRHLHLADQHPEGTLHPACIRLAELHSDAVDYPKTGVPVSIRALPNPPIRMKPDFMCQEFDSSKKGEEYYESPKVLGRLFRKIPAERIEVLSHRGSEGEIIESYRIRNPEDNRLGRFYGALDEDRSMTRKIETKIKRRYGDRYAVEGEIERRLQLELTSLLRWFGTELMKICKRNNISKSEPHLAESEAFLGVILVSCDRFQKRAALSRLLDQSSLLFDQLRSTILGASGQASLHHDNDDNDDVNNDDDDGDGDDDDDDDDRDDEGEDEDEDFRIIQRAHTAWLVATQADIGCFGTHSFGFITLGILLNHIDLD